MWCDWLVVDVLNFVDVFEVVCVLDVLFVEWDVDCFWVILDGFYVVGGCDDWFDEVVYVNVGC